MINSNLFKIFTIKIYYLNYNSLLLRFARNPLLYGIRAQPDIVGA